jgi:dTDP-4-dehydrorhamnose reductase
VKVFITGAAGALGAEMQRILHRERIDFLPTDLKELNITDQEKTAAVVGNYRPDVILHLAAISDVDACEQNRELALRTNALGSLGLARCTERIGAKIIYLSSNFVFDGKGNHAYQELSVPNPINEYGRTKLLGEHYIKDNCHRFFIVRTAWLFGKNSKTFIPRFLVEPRKPGSINVIRDQIGSFTYIPDLAEAICLLITSEDYGIYHLVNRGVGSWYDFALAAKGLMGFKTEIEPVNTATLKLAAPRPRFAPLDSSHFEAGFRRSLPEWQDALKRFIQTIH